jgi:TetR/AcrR family transcriptional regulator, repressor for neighboring sulfatase
VTRKPANQQRTRRKPEEARTRILELAESRLAEGGPEAVRVQALAAELGITDAAIYHHFGNRDGLLDALARFGARRLRESMEEVVAGHEARASDIAALVELAVDAFERRGYARLVLWLGGAGIPADRGSGMFDAVVDAFEAARAASGETGGDPSEPRHLAALMVMVCAAEPLFGDMSRRSVSLPGSKLATKKFRTWLAAMIADRLCATGPDRRPRAPKRA